MDSIVENAYRFTKELMMNNEIRFTTKSGSECTVTTEYTIEEEGNEGLYIIFREDNSNNLIELFMTEINTGLIHSYLVGLIRNC